MLILSSTIHNLNIMILANIAKQVVRTMSTFRLALVQLEVNEVKRKNVERAVSYISSAKEHNADIIALPECFNSPYGIRNNLFFFSIIYYVCNNYIEKIVN
ncbi:omega-amidase NIT2-like [Bombus vosnesenskii]|uniref:Omega-amidase NIT2-like n=1 Tax=Bombus vosnesenskii TaxID=207650 RepID=A0A6J3LGD7_9HYME|nr:omega-amidase NIT2-like [Bombus vosnesenskii]